MSRTVSPKSRQPIASSNPGTGIGVEVLGIGEIWPKLRCRLVFGFVVGLLSWKRKEGLGDVVMDGEVIGRLSA